MKTTKKDRDNVRNYFMEIEMDQLARETTFAAFDDLDQLDEAVTELQQSSQELLSHKTPS